MYGQKMLFLDSVDEIADDEETGCCGEVEVVGDSGLKLETNELLTLDAVDGPEVLV